MTSFEKKLSLGILFLTTLFYIFGGQSQNVKYILINTVMANLILIECFSFSHNTYLTVNLLITVIIILYF